MDQDRSDIGMIGLGVMGRNLVLNFADHGFSVAGYDREPSQVRALGEEKEGRPVFAARSLAEFLGRLKAPKAVMMLVPAGGPVDAVIAELAPRLARGDLIIDGGNSLFKDTDRRMAALSGRGILYLGVGVSGGEEGARRGPSIMPGGPGDAYECVRPILEAAAAKVNGEPCVTYLGPGSAGHYVKMVHNGIEYGLMELIAESYDLMKRGLGLGNDELAEVFEGWNRGELNGYLIEIAARVFQRVDERTGGRLIDLIRDQARQKGTGAWMSQDAMQLGAAVPTIDVAVAMRNLSDRKETRVAASRTLGGSTQVLAGERGAFLTALRGALYGAMILTYAQGMSQLRRASQAYGYGLCLDEVARIWRGGCIIRAAVLEEIRRAYGSKPDLPTILLDERLGREASARASDLRLVVRAAAEAGIPAAAFAVSLAYFDAVRSAHLPANLIQAQRDYFGAHTYERVDAAGVFHTRWSDDAKEGA
jgi:6-phosphogluconate dehydrogenase